MTRDFGPVALFVDRLISAGRAGGAGISIAIDGQPAFQYLAGEAVLGRPATPDTLWPAASVTKLFTASAVMSLVEDGQLTLETKVSTNFPDFQGGGREEITLRQLLTHTSGLPFDPPNLIELLEAHSDIDAIVAHAFTDALLFPPGMGQLYSNTGYGIAGAMAAKVAGMSFPELVRTRVLESAGLKRTYFQLPPTCYPDLAQVAGMTGEGTDWALFGSPYGTQIGHPANGISATLSDLMRFLLLFDPYGPKTLHSAAGLAAMTTDQTGRSAVRAPATPIASWGAGFVVKSEGADAGIASPESYGHMGSTGCVAWIDPRYRVSVVFVSNSHLSRGEDEWRNRLDAVVSVALAAVTKPG